MFVKFCEGNQMTMIPQQLCICFFTVKKKFPHYFQMILANLPPVGGQGLTGQTGKRHFGSCLAPSPCSLCFSIRFQDLINLKDRSTIENEHQTLNRFRNKFSMTQGVYRLVSILEYKINSFNLYFITVIQQVCR